MGVSIGFRERPFTRTTVSADDRSVARRTVRVFGHGRELNPIAAGGRSELAGDALEGIVRVARPKCYAELKLMGIHDGAPLTSR